MCPAKVPVPRFFGDPGFGEHVPVVDKRRGPCAFDLGEPLQICGGDLAKAHALDTALVSHALLITFVGQIPTNDFRRRDMRTSLVIKPLFDAPAPRHPLIRAWVELEPGRPDTPLDLPGAVTELGFVVRRLTVKTDENRCAGDGFWHAGSRGGAGFPGSSPSRTATPSAADSAGRLARLPGSDGHNFPPKLDRGGRGRPGLPRQPLGQAFEILVGASAAVPGCCALSSRGQRPDLCAPVRRPATHRSESP